MRLPVNNKDYKTMYEGLVETLSKHGESGDVLSWVEILYKKAIVQTFAQPKTDQLVEALELMVQQYGGMVDGGVTDEARIAVEKAEKALSLHKQSPTKAGMSVEEHYTLDEIMNVLVRFNSVVNGVSPETIKNALIEERGKRCY